MMMYKILLEYLAKKIEVCNEMCKNTSFKLKL